MKDETSIITWYPRTGFLVNVIVGAPHVENGSLHKENQFAGAFLITTLHLPGEIAMRPHNFAHTSATAQKVVLRWRGLCVSFFRAGQFYLLKNIVLFNLVRLQTCCLHLKGG